MSLRVRPAVPGDAEGIGAVHVETWRATYPGLVPDRYLLDLSPAIQAQRWRTMIQRPSAGEILVAEDPVAGVVGFGSSGPARYRRAPARAEIFTLYVDVDHQGRGLGRALLTALLRGLHRNGYPDAFLWVLAGNPARFFYEAMGGRHLGRQKEAFAGALLEEEAYCWPDLSEWLTEGSSSRRDGA